MKKVDFTIRIILGIGLVFFGLNGFFHWMIPPKGPQAEAQFLMALDSANYIFPLVYTTLVLSGVALLINKFVPVALMVLAPIFINIVLIHINFNPQGILFGVVFSVLILILFYSRWSVYKPLFKND